MFELFKFIFTKTSFCFILLLEATSYNSELLLINNQISLKSHGKLSRIGKYLNNKIQIMEEINQKATALNVCIKF